MATYAGTLTIRVTTVQFGMSCHTNTDDLIGITRETIGYIMGTVYYIHYITVEGGLFDIENGEQTDYSTQETKNKWILRRRRRKSYNNHH